MCQRAIVGERITMRAHMQITTIGVDLAKNVFQVHCVDAVGDNVSITLFRFCNSCRVQRRLWIAPALRAPTLSEYQMNSLATFSSASRLHCAISRQTLELKMR